MGLQSFGRIFVCAAIAVVALVLVPMVFIGALLGASSAASCTTAAATPTAFGDPSGDDPAEMPPLEIALRIYAVGRGMQMDDRRILTAYAVVLVESGGGVTMRNVSGGDASSTGAFQQQDFAPWNARNRNNVAAAATTFFEQLRSFDHGQSVGELAADIQRPRSDLRFKYALAVARARWFLEKVKSGGLPGTGQGLGSITASGTACGGALGPPGRGKIDEGSNDLLPPSNAPPRVVKVIEAANQINELPYLWGGGHGAWWSPGGYDCSGAVSYALHGGGFLDQPLDSGALAGWGRPGPGSWITVYANSGHAFMYVAGVRFDTSSYEPVSSGDGPRWRATDRPKAGFSVTHPQGF